MLTPKESKQIADAFDLLESYGIFCVVPGWYDLSDSEDAVEFANDPDSYYERRNPDFNRS